MKHKIKNKLKSFIEIILIVFLFVLFSYIIQKKLDFFDMVFRGRFILGIILYFLIMVFETVVAPLSVLPLVPVASNLWGWEITSILNILSWTSGAIIAFLIARKYGQPIVKKIIPLEKIEKIEEHINEDRIFISIVVWRMFLPVDILSYGLGLLSAVNLRTYIPATVIGIIPFAILISYLGELPFLFQMIGVAISAIIFLVGLLIYQTKKL